MKEIKIIKLVSFLLFAIPLSALLFVLSASNHLITYNAHSFPNGIQKEHKIICNESNEFCSAIPSKKIKLTECSLKKYKELYTKNGVVIKDTTSVDDILNVVKKNKNDLFHFEIVWTP